MMERPLTIHAARQSDVVAFAVVGLVAAGMAVGVWFVPPNSPNEQGPGVAVSVICGILCLGAWIGCFLYGRNRKTTWLIDDRSVRMERAGKVLWECPWNEYGGWRRQASKPFSNPDRYEVIDRQGGVVGEFRLMSQAGDIAFFKRELDVNTPRGGPTPERLETRRNIKQRSRRLNLVLLFGGICLGLAGLGLHWVVVGAVNDSSGPSRFRDWITAHPSGVVVPLPLYLFGVIFASLGYFGLLGARFPAMFDARRYRPVYGPSLRDFRLDHKGSLPVVAMVEGRTYGYLDPEAFKRGLQGTQGMLALLVPLTFAFPLIILIPVPNRDTSEMLSTCAILVVMSAALIVANLVVSRSVRRRQAVLDDRFRLIGTELVVVRNGLEERYDWSGKEALGNPKTEIFLGYRYRFGTYSLDPRFLIEVPADADLAEMAEMRDRIEASI